MWRRLGRIHDYRGAAVERHMQCPTVLDMGTRLRVFYADRDEHNRSFIAYLDVHRDNPRQMIAHMPTPLMELGQPGTFDDDGMMPSCIVKDGEKTLLYYSGWNRGVSVPYRNSVGLAYSKDGETFTRAFEGPIMDRTAKEPYLAVTPFVIKHEGFWRCWYVGGTKWVEIDGHLEPLYVIRFAYSGNGIRWMRSGKTCIEPSYEFEAFSNPSVLKTEAGYEVWYCTRDSKDYRSGPGAYRIEHAVSDDGIEWERVPEVWQPAQAWESEMQAYPYVLEVNGRRLMFYNGNGFGRTGIGVAEWLA